jgi:hypothetical protein
VGAADYIGTINRSIRMYNDFAWGGYLIYDLYPKHLVFIDGRADMYREGIFEDFIAVQSVQPGWREILNGSGVNLVLIQHDTPLGYARDHVPDWRVTY